MLKISVVVPVYNVENYLDDCLNSIVNQSYRNLEIIIINDGSTDNSRLICEQYEQLDNRIILINKKNGGLSDARNFGIKVATGDYITFIDSDDYVSLDYISELVKYRKNDSQIIIAGVAYVRQNSINLENSFDTKFYSREQALDNMHRAILSIPFSTAWGKLVPLDFYKKEQFPVGKLHEDEYVTYKIYIRYSNIVFIDRPLYFYRMRNNSIMNVRKSSKNLMVLDAFNERIILLEKNNLPIQKNLVSYYRNIFLFKNVLSDDEKEAFSNYIEYHLDFVCLKIGKQKLSFREKLKLLFYKYFGKYYFIRSL